MLLKVCVNKQFNPKASEISLLPLRTPLHGLEGGDEAPAVPADVALETHEHVVPGAAELLRLRLGVTQLSQPRGLRIWASVNLGELRKFIYTKRKRPRKSIFFFDLRRCSI